MNGYRHAESYIRQLNGEACKTNYVSEDGYQTGAWIRGQCRGLKHGTTSPEHAALLKKIGLVAEQKESTVKLQRQVILPIQKSNQEQVQGVLGK